MVRVKAEDRIGQVFGSLTILDVFREGRRTYAKSECSCGNVKTIRLDGIVQGSVLSCGCIALENSKNLNRSHGMYKTPTYHTWDDMKDRCLNHNSDNYPRYGGKGITVCEKWLTFEGFLDDMGVRPEGYTLDRIDANAGYTKDNCRWADLSTQSRNQSKRNPQTSYSSYKGVTFDKRAKTGGWVMCVTKDYISVRKSFPSEEKAASAFNFCTKFLFQESVEMNDVNCCLSDNDKILLNSLLRERFNTTP